MDITDVANYFDNQEFDEYLFASSTWRLLSVKARLKLADMFLSIYNKPTRRRMLHCAPDNKPTSSVLRVASTGEIFMVGSSQEDTFQGTSYRVVVGLHEIRGSATVNRLTPSVTLGIKGWATNVLVRNSFADIELRSVNESQDRELINEGHFFLVMPSDETLVKHDTVTLAGVVYYILEVYVDSEYKTARVTSHPDERVDFVYASITGESYNGATQTVTTNSTSYNVTAKVVPIISEDNQASEVTSQFIKVMILSSFISFSPKVKDKITYLGQVYTVQKVERDSSLREWHLVASLRGT